jgi:glycosyltransferase involved in cell wall biosynthesis
MKILLSNPSKQYTHQTAKALNIGKKDFVFATSYWYYPSRWFEVVITAIRSSFKNNLLRKYSKELPRHFVQDHFRGIVFSFLGRFFYSIEERSFKEDCIHDSWAKKLIKKYHPSIIIGYEKSCLKSFLEAKKYGAVTILDLAQVHVNFIEELRDKFNFFRKITGDEKLFEKIKTIKLEEYKLADKILVLSEFAKQTMLDNGIEEKKLKLVNLGFDASKFTLKQKYVTDQTVTFKMIFVGTVSYRKGIHLLLNFMQSTNLNIQLTIVGPLGEGITKEMFNHPAIHYHPFVHHEELVKIFHASDLFVFPSYLDSWAMVVIEAMACGLPVIVTENTGAKEVVNNNCGFIIPVDSKAALKEKIEYFYHHRSEIERMGKNARAGAEQYNWEQYYKTVNEVIEEAENSKNKNN